MAKTPLKPIAVKNQPAKEIVKQPAKEVKQDPEIDSIQEQEFETPEDRKKWIIEQCQKYGADAYFRSVIKNKK